MSDSNQEQPSDQGADQSSSEAQRLLAEIRKLRAQAEEQFKLAETARKNADSEGLFAVNAKKACEDHATAISQIKGSVESEVTTIRSSKQTSDEYLAALTTAKATMEADTKVILDRRKEAELAAQSIAATSEACTSRMQEIEKTKTAVAEALKMTTESREAVIQAQNSAEASQKKAESSSVDAQEKVNLIEKNRATSAQQCLDVQKALDNAQASETKLGTVLAHIEKSDEISIGYEARLTKLAAESELLMKRIDSLLPGAASASLASSFNAQKLRFAGPQKRWLITFIGCIAALVLVALPSFLAALGIQIPGHSSDSALSDIWRGLMLRMPIAIPLVWLAIYAGRNYMLSLRLEEEYAYKEAVSTAFEGYKREMTEIAAGDAANPSPLIKLCTNILAAIAERPGRIYEGKHSDITILNETQRAAQEAKELATKQIAAR
jgi:predicted HNH restriction endonuclease